MSNVVPFNSSQDVTQELTEAWGRIADLEEELEQFEDAKKRLGNIDAIGRDFVRLVVDLDDLFGIRRLPFPIRLRIETLCKRLGKDRPRW